GRCSTATPDYQAVRPRFGDQCHSHYDPANLSSYSAAHRPAVHARGLVHLSVRAEKTGAAGARTKGKGQCGFDRRSRSANARKENGAQTKRGSASRKGAP